jgi:hypothetical protein
VQDLAIGRVALAGGGKAVLTCDQSAGRHLVKSQGACLIGTNGGG